MKYAVSPTEQTVRNRNYQGTPSRNEIRPFLAWDGEGYTDDTGEHHYYLFGCSDGRYISSPSLHANECFDLLLTTPRKAINVIFAGGYDVVMMIRHYPTEVVERILKGKTVWHDGYRIQYFKGKFLTVGRGGISRTLYDCFSYFQVSFVKACREYLGNDEVLERMEATKAIRDSFTLDNLETDVIPYWREELAYLVRLMDSLRERLNRVSVFPTQWHGPGAVAGAILKSHGIANHMQHNEQIADIARHAYYGGRFEQFKIGRAIGPIYQYDIRSAYPAAITEMYSLAGALWHHADRGLYPTNLNPYGLYRIDYHSDRFGLHPFPWRDHDGRIYFPPIVKDSWYWGVEIMTAYNRMRDYQLEGTIKVHEGWEPVLGPHCFEWVGLMYRNRQKMKELKDPAQLALKLCLNSLYGKLAQSKGARYVEGKGWTVPKYHQMEWAGWITARTRAQIFAAAAQAGSNLIAIETDSVTSTVPLTLPCSDRLGDWEATVLDEILYIQSGVYFCRKPGEDWKIKSRGFSPRGHTIDRWLDVMGQLPNDPTVTVKQTVRRFGTIPTSQHFARWYDIEREANLVGGKTKRVHLPAFMGGQSVCDGCNGKYSFAQGMHDLVVPSWAIPMGQPSKPHPLPWAKDDGYAPFGTGLFIAEEEIALEFSTLEQLLDSEIP